MEFMDHIPIGKRTFIALDLETSGLSPDSSEILEIGAIKFNQDGILDTFSQYAKPKNPISMESTRVHGLTDSMLQTALPLKEVLSDFLYFSRDCIWVIHNAVFDISFLKLAFK